MAVTRHDLRGDGLGAQTEARADKSLDGRIDVGKGTHRAGELTERNLLPGLAQACTIARHLRVPVRGFETEGNRLGMHAVSATDHDRLFVLAGKTLKDA